MPRSSSPAPFLSFARKLLASEGKDARSSEEIAGVTVEACERISRHLARLLGNDGARAILDRSVTVARKTFPWIEGLGAATTGSMAGFHGSLEKQAPGAALEASALVVATLIELIARFIGDTLALGLLHELWPDVFPAAATQEKS